MTAIQKQQGKASSNNNGLGSPLKADRTFHLPQIKPQKLSEKKPLEIQLNKTAQRLSPISSVTVLNARSNSYLTKSPKTKSPSKVSQQSKRSVQPTAEKNPKPKDFASFANLHQFVN